MKLVTRTTLAAALAAALLLACGGEEEKNIPTHERLPNTSPANVLKNVELSFNTGDYDLFKACLSPNFVFYFNPNDVGKPSINDPEYFIPVSWNYNQMTNAIKNMFNRAFSIEMGIPTGTVGTPDSHDTIWDANNICITMTLMTDEDNGFRIGSGFCNFEFEKYEENGEGRWRLTKWWDYSREVGATTANLDVSPASLGRVLALYR